MEAIVVKFDKEYAPKIRRIRNSVFTNEQHIDPDMDFDGQDYDAVHALIICNRKYVGTGRLLNESLSWRPKTCSRFLREVGLFNIW